MLFKIVYTEHLKKYLLSSNLILYLLIIGEIKIIQGSMVLNFLMYKENRYIYIHNKSNALNNCKIKMQIQQMFRI